MKLFYSPGACSLASHIIAVEAGLDVTPIKVILSEQKTEHGEDFSMINPKGYIPALKTKNGQILTEGSVILQYLADEKPELNLIPKSDTFDRYKAQEWLAFIATEIHKGYGPLWNKSITLENKEAVLVRLHKRLAYVEKYLIGKKYLLNDTFGVADAYLFTILNWSSMLSVDISMYENIVAYHKNIMQIPSVQSAMKAEGLI